MVSDAPNEAEGERMKAITKAFQLQFMPTEMETSGGSVCL